MITQGLLWGYSGGHFGGNLESSLGVLQDHFGGTLKFNLEVLWGHIGGTMDFTLGSILVLYEN